MGEDRLENGTSLQPAMQRMPVAHVTRIDVPWQLLTVPNSAY
jgi:hypothetical protein